MARSIHKLTPERVKHKAKHLGLHADGGGLYLCVKSPKSASWVFRYMLKGKAREMGFGSYPEISLDAARDKARQARESKAAGKDPIEARESDLASLRLQAAKAITFRHCMEGYLAAHRGGWRSRHAIDWKVSLETHALPILGDIAVIDIDRALVVRVMESIWKTKRETARRLRGRIEAVLDWAAARDYRSGDNPARWKGPLSKLFSARKVRDVKHFAALPYSDLPAFMEKLNPERTVGAEALRFTILTAARVGEATRATWSEIDLERAIWTVPGERTKAAREHRVPLSKPALTILRSRLEVTNGDGFIFEGERPKRPVSLVTVMTTLRRIKPIGVTVHGFRSTFRDWAEETTNFSGSVAEVALAHVVGDKVEAAYRRGDLFEKRRKLMDAWARFATAPVQETGKVISINKKGAAT